MPLSASRRAGRFWRAPRWPPQARRADAGWQRRPVKQAALHEGRGVREGSAMRLGKEIHAHQNGNMALPRLVHHLQDLHIRLTNLATMLAALEAQQAAGGSVDLRTLRDPSGGRLTTPSRC
jgi:hypothetical protein